MITVKVNWVKSYPQTHRKIVSVTVTPNWFLRNIFFQPVRDVAFEGWGNHFKLLKLSRNVQHNKPNNGQGI